MSLDYNLEEKLQIDKSRKIISNGQECLNICFNEIEVFHRNSRFFALSGAGVSLEFQAAPLWKRLRLKPLFVPRPHA